MTSMAVISPETCGGERGNNVLSPTTIDVFSLVEVMRKRDKINPEGIWVVKGGQGREI